MSAGIDEVREEAARRTVERAARIAKEAEAAGWYGARALFVRELRRFLGLSGMEAHELRECHQQRRQHLRPFPPSTRQNSRRLGYSRRA